MVIIVSATGVLILNLTTTIITNVAQASTCSGTSGTHRGSDSFSTTFSGSCSSVHVAVQPFVGHIANFGKSSCSSASFSQKKGIVVGDLGDGAVSCSSPSP
jgi:hypothetical protein